eukprot:3486962-Lingulodinium_polyedra.AAC.1
MRTAGDMPVLDAPPDDVAHGQPFEKEGPCDAGAWMVTLVAGDVLVAGLATGSKVTLQGAGEQAEVVAARKVWLRITVPGDA